jgi:hypothetical protein
VSNPSVSGVDSEEGDPFPSQEIPAFIAVYQALRTIHQALATYFTIGIGLLTAGLT